MTVPTAEWMPRARKLAEDLVAAGKLWSPQWREALCVVPRHELVPDVLRRDPDGSWHHLDTTTDQGQQEWLEQVYSNRASLTAVAERWESRGLRSSSSMPGLMTRMLETLEIRDGDRVLEIGTGTGYNAALLTQRLGDTNVFSVDVEPDLVELARRRLARIGYHPTLVVADGAAGLAEHAPFDRIIATCAVPAVPWAWVEQTSPGGVILTDLKTARGAGSLVRLTRYPDHAEGHFDPTYTAFMDLRHHPADQAPDRPRPRRQPQRTPERRTTTLNPRTPWEALVVWFLASFDLGSDLSLGYGRPDEDGKHRHLHHRGRRIVGAGDPRRRPWRAPGHRERPPPGMANHRRRTRLDAHVLWTTLDQPSWDRFGLTVTKDHQQVWLDTPTSAHSWPLAPVQRQDRVTATVGSVESEA